MRGVRAAAAVPLAALVVVCMLQPSCGGTRRSATPAAAEEAEALLADGLARKRMLTGKIGPSNVHIVEGAIAKFEEALAVYEAALPGGRDEAKAPGLPAGTVIDVEGRGRGRVTAFNSYWTSAATHSVEFAGGGPDDTVELDLQAETWTVQLRADGTAAAEPVWGEPGTSILDELAGAWYHLGNARKEMAGGSLTDYTRKPGHAEGKKAAELFGKLESAVRGGNRKGAAAQAAAKRQAECYMMMDDFTAARPVWQRYLQYKTKGDLLKLDATERADMLMSFLNSHDPDEIEFAVQIFDASMRRKELPYDKRQQKQMRVHSLVNMRLHELVAHFNAAAAAATAGAAPDAGAKAAKYSQLIEMQWQNMARAFPWRHRTQTPTRFDGSIDAAGSPPQPWLDWESDPNFEVCRALEAHKEEIMAEYRAHVGAGGGSSSSVTISDSPDKTINPPPPTAVKELLARAMELSEQGAIAEEDVDDAMEQDSPSQALQALIAAVASPPPPPADDADDDASSSVSSSPTTLFTGNHADISIVGSGSAEKWQYLYVKQSGSKGKTGQLEDETCQHFPKTCAVLHSLPSVMWMYNATRCTNGVCPFPPATVSPKEAAQPAGVAAFYKLKPGTVVPMHNGPTNQRLKCQLGVDVPPGVWITVGNVSREWKQGAIMSFDDSYHHSVDASQAEATRVVFDISFWHPRLGPSLFPPFNHECWAGGGGSPGDGGACWEVQREYAAGQQPQQQKRSANKAEL